MANILSITIVPVTIVAICGPKIVIIGNIAFQNMLKAIPNPDKPWLWQLIYNLIYNI